MPEDPEKYVDREKLQKLRDDLEEARSEHRSIREAIRQLVSVVSDLPHRRDLDAIRSTQQGMDIRQQEMISMLRVALFRLIGIVATAATAIAAGIKDSDFLSRILDRF